MKIHITAKPNAKKNEVEKIDETHYKVSIKASPKEGRANEAVIEALHEYFRRPRSSISIVSGLSSRHKVIEIN